METVAKTALGVAMVRAALAIDPYAQRFVDAAPGAFAQNNPDGSLGRAFAAHVATRTRFFDDYLQAAGDRQVVLLAAGLDTRALRLEWPAGTRLFELDRPEIFAFKEPLIADVTPTCERVVVPVDLREPWTGELVAAGYDRTRPTAWLAEGLLIYLTPDETHALFTAVGDVSAPGCRLAFEHGDSLTRGAAHMAGFREYAQIWKHGGDDAPAWLRTHGWRVRLDPGFLTAVRI